MFLSVDYFDFKNKRAVVTGGARGIGAATVALLRECGARAESLDVAEGCDVTDEHAVKAAFERIGEIDILVNNAGRAARKPAVDLQKSEWDAVLDLNLTATFLCSRLAHPHMVPAAPVVAEYTCPMHPEVRSPKPGNCPKCGMALVPVAGAEEDKSELRDMAAPQTLPADPAQSLILGFALEHASVLAPPDVAPPKSFLS